MNSINCVIVGDPMVGKTSLLKRHTDNTFDKDYKATVFIDHVDILSIYSKKKHIQLDLWDTAGLEGPECFRALSNLEIDAFIICFSIMSPDSYENVSWKWSKEVKNFCPNATVILVGTMQDIYNDIEELLKLKALKKMPKFYIQGLELAVKIDAYEYCECSALTGQGVKDVFTKVIDAVLENRSSADTSKGKKRECVIS